VNFVVAQDDVDDVDRVDVETEPSSTSTSQDEEQLRDDDALYISPAAYDSAYEQIVRPDRAVYLPGYFRRWLRSIGPDLGWMYVSFRQAAYLAGARAGSQSSRFSGKQLASMSGISERTYWNRVNNPATWQKLSGLVKIIAGGDEWVKGPTPRRLPRRYTIAMTLPLTPADTSSLRHWIAAHIEAHGGVEGVLRAAVTTPLDELIPLDTKTKDDDQACLSVPARSQALTVRALLHDLFKDELADGLLDSLASALQAHIMPQNDLIVISLFFIEHILPHLDAGPGWMLILLRDMCYVNPENGESRNRVTVKGGYAEIAGWLGMSRPRTVWDWFNEKNGPKHSEPGMLKNPVVRVYMREVAGPKSEDFVRSSRTFEALIEDIPHEIMEAALTDNLAALTTGRDATFTIGMTPLADHRDATFTIAVTRFAHYLDATFTIVVTLLAHHRDAACIVKSSLTLKPNSLTLKPLTLNPQPSQKTETETENSPAPTQPTTSKSGGMGNIAFWDFDYLMSNNSVNPGSKVNLLKTNKKFGRSISSLSTGFVSWLLYAYSPAGSKISDPVGLAIKRLCENVSAGAGGDFNRLAKLNPYALKSLFDADMANVGLDESLEAGIYTLNFHDLQAIHKRELYRRLFGDLEDG
ncbi:MAG: hypothetical protein Q7J80_12800, partial [Anaerolineales bacterium]|nr:hypothetical protein [Anaerolineales bacterium]